MSFHRSSCAGDEVTAVVAAAAVTAVATSTMTSTQRTRTARGPEAAALRREAAVLTRARHPRRPARLVPSPTEAEMARALSAARPELAATRGQSATIPAKGAPGRSPP